MARPATTTSVGRSVGRSVPLSSSPWRSCHVRVPDCPTNTAPHRSPAYSTTKHLMSRLLPNPYPQRSHSYQSALPQSHHSSPSTNQRTVTTAASHSHSSSITAWELWQQERCFMASPQSPPPCVLLSPRHWSAPCLTVAAATPPWLTLRPGHLYELAGEAGSGKTQIALSLCVDAAIVMMTTGTSLVAPDSVPPRPVAVAPAPVHAVYLALGSTQLASHAVHRWQQMVRARRSQTLQPAPQQDSTTTTDILQRLVVKPIVHKDQWDDLLLYELEALLQKQAQPSTTPTTTTATSSQHPVQLVVVDSLANLFRFLEDEDQNNNSNSRSSNSETKPPSGGAPSVAIQNRAASFFRLAARLKQLACQYHFVVLVLNQVTTTPVSSADPIQPANSPRLDPE